jgi:hypothetical protein
VIMMGAGTRWAEQAAVQKQVAVLISVTSSPAAACAAQRGRSLWEMPLQSFRGSSESNPSSVNDDGPADQG